jgi:hypothetical protein
MLTNVTQHILSGLYILHNKIFASILQAAESNDYSLQRNGLHISTATKGAQRDAYSLSPPYLLGSPVDYIGPAALACVAKPLVSILTNTFTILDDNTNATVTNFTYGYSPIAIIFVIIVAAIMATFAVFTGFKRFKSGMPMADSCSAAISATCHPVPGLERIVELDAPLQWGVMGVTAVGLTHSGFSSRQA